MLSNPKLYEINTRVWIKQFEKGTTLSSIPLKIWNNFVEKGIDFIWLLGVWETCTGLIEKSCFSADLITSYSRSLENWTHEDVIGSPFSINNYRVNPALGTWEDLKKLRQTLNGMGIKLVLDFIPNHFGAESELIETNPEIFLKGDKELFDRDPFTFFKAKENENLVYAHGRDPLFPAWTDTAQVNYFNEETRNFMSDILLKLTEVCDGVRSDMAMLQLNNVFQNTWLGVLNKFNFQKPNDEFWKSAIEKVKRKFPKFIFIAEVYWNLEWDLQQLGFDYTYDKRLLDRLAANDIPGVKAHLQAEKNFQMKSVRFLENHDEARSVTKFGKKQAFAAAVLFSTIQGMKLFYDGQFEGKKIKLPLQLGREPEEKVSYSLKIHYDKILSITKDEIFEFGQWSMLEPEQAAENNFSSEFIFAWRWKLGNENRIIVVNYSEHASRCRLKFDLSEASNEIILVDLLSGEKYHRNADEIRNTGLFIELKCYGSHIFSFTD